MTKCISKELNICEYMCTALKYCNSGTSIKWFFCSSMINATKMEHLNVNVLMTLDNVNRTSMIRA